MRILVIFAASAIALLGACAQTPEPPPAPSTASVAKDWILIAPPDNIVTVAFLDTFEFLPEHQARFPRGTNGLSEQDQASMEDLFQQVAAEAAAEDRLEILTEIAVLTEAPIEEWREVRVFKSAVSCNATREELIKITGEQTKKVGAYPRMPREEYQWPLLAKSFQWSRCVPSEMAPSVLGG